MSKMLEKTKMNDSYGSTIPEKPIDEYTEDEIKQMFLEMFFWVAENRVSWLREAIEIKKAVLLAKKVEET